MAQQAYVAYSVCEGISPEDLAQKVQMMIVQGFIPCGGICVAAGHGLTGAAGVRFYQSLFLHVAKEVPDGTGPWKPTEVPPPPGGGPEDERAEFPPTDPGA